MSKQKQSWSAGRLRKVLGLVLVGLLAGQGAQAAIVETFFVPIPETDTRTAFLTLDTSFPDSTIHSVVAIAANGDIVLTWDHREDGFEADLESPVQTSTEVWGDGDDTNGCAPNVNGVPVVCNPGNDVLNGGDVILVEDDVFANPRNPATVLYDGGDKFGVTAAVAVTRAAWGLTRGTVLAGAVEVFATKDWGTSFEAPGGEGLASCTSGADSTNFCMFEDTRFAIMAASNGTSVVVDTNGDGTPEVSTVLNQGQSLLVDAVQIGGTVTSSASVQVDLLTGDIGANYESRWYTMLPTGDWSNAYLSPVGTTDGTDPSVVLLYNPDTTALTIDVTTQGGTAPVNVPANSVVKYQMPANQGARFASADARPFFAIGEVDDDQQVHDWGYTLIPETKLSTILKVGWAPGSDDIDATPGPDDPDASPVWVTAASDTTVCVDFDDDGTADQTLALTALQSLRITDSDGDMTTARIFSSTNTLCLDADGAILAGAWGQDPANAPTGNPALDMGTTVLGISSLSVVKQSVLVVDVNGDGYITPGDTLQYIINIENPGTSPAVNIIVSDTPDANTTYVSGTTQQDGVPIADDAGPATPFPLDEGGYNIGTLDPGDSTTVAFWAEVNLGVPDGTLVVNTARAASDDSAVITDDADNPVGPVNRIEGTVFVDRDGDGVFDANEFGYQGIVVELQDGVCTPGVDCTRVLTDANGAYRFDVGSAGNFTIVTDVISHPLGAVLTTDNVETAIFGAPSGGVDTGNDFGFSLPLSIAKTSAIVIDAAPPSGAGEVSPGDVVEYTLTIGNTTGARQSNIVVSDPLPDGVSYVAQSTQATGPRVGSGGIRVTEYYIAAGQFTGTSYDLTLGQDLASDYFVIIQGAQAANDGGPDENYARLTQDPFGTGDLGSSSGSNVIRFERGNAIADWIGVVTVVESLSGAATNGFTLLDVQSVVHSAAGTSGTDTAGTGWSDINQVALIGGFNGAGCVSTDINQEDHGNCHARLFPSGGNTINWARSSSSVKNILRTATSTVMVVEWGSEWTVQRVNVTGSNGDSGIDATGEYNTAAISAVARDNTWVWGTGYGTDTPIRETAEAAAITLGDGVNQNATESQVAIGLYANGGISFDVYAMTHPDLAVDYRFQPDGAEAATTDVTVDAAGGERMALSYNGHDSNRNDRWPAAMYSARYVTGTTVRLETQRVDGDFAAWVQGIDFSAIQGVVSQTLDNIPAGVNADLVDGVPSDLVEAGDAFLLEPSGSGSDSMTVTFRVQVDAPLDPFFAALNNVGSASSDQSGAVNGAAIDPVDPGGTIGDRVWLDVDGDGVQDVGEPGIEGVTVELRDGTCTPSVNCATDITDGYGRYVFDHVYPGTYTVVVIAGVPAGLSLAPGNGGSKGPMLITGNESLLDNDFGYVPNTGTAVIGDRVWSDDDGDGLQDPGEAGIANVTVRLISAGPDGVFGTGDDVVVDTTTTAPDGDYLFVGIAPGEYVVRVDSADPDIAGFTPTSGPQSAGGYESAPVTAVADQAVVEVDFGFANPALYSISDKTWYDIDGDGLLDIGEPGLAGVTVSLLDGSGNTVATTISGADGSFSFSGVADGSYTVNITDNNAVLHQVGGTTVAAQNRQLGVTISGADAVGINFGYYAPGAIGDRVWSDADGDGMQDAGELGIGGVLVNLVDPVTSAVLAFTTTAADGSFLFVGYDLGTYRVEMDASNFLAGMPLDGYTQTGDPDETGTCVACDHVGTANVTTTSNNVFDLDFGYRNTVLLDIAGNVFDDLDLDGVDDGAGEPGLAGVTIALRDTSGNVLATTTTDANGDYQFADMPDGNYVVAVTDDNDVLNAYQLTSGLDELPVTVNAAADAADGSPDGIVSGNDFGYARTPGTGAIGDSVWLDANTDGVRGPAEAGLPGITVRVYEDTNGSGVRDGGDTLIATTVTDAQGRYNFPGLAAGDYLVEVDGATLPADLIETTYAGVDPSAVIALSKGEDYDNADFGYVPNGGTAVLGDRVWYDANGDGVEDPGEAGIAGIDVVVINQATSTEVARVATGADGSWLVTNLPAGNYIVMYDRSDVQALGYDQTQPTNMAAGDDHYQVTVAAAAVVTHLDFGFNIDPAAPDSQGSIGDKVFLDADEDGVFDTGEGIAGVTVNLLDSGGNIIATTTTDADGGYDFTGLPAADYQVDVTDLSGMLAGLNLALGSDPTATISLAVGQDYNDADFGYRASDTPSIGSGVIGDKVWRDLNNNGLFDVGEPGYQGVTMELWLDTDGNGLLAPGTDNLIRSAVTDANGDYQFDALPAGNYLVVLTDDNGVTSGFPQTADPGGPCGVCVTISAVVLPADGTNFAQDFAFTLFSGSAIRGTVFEDENNNGDTVPSQESGEPGISGATVSLYRVIGGQRYLIGTTTSDGSGDYAFTNLPDGAYEIEVDVAGTVAEKYQQTTQGGSGGVHAVTLAGADSVDNDFGYYDSGAITNPVTLRSFYAEPNGDAVSFSWTTATEVGNVGFYLYVKHDGDWQAVNDALIPSLHGDSVRVQHYGFAAAVTGEVFALVDIDMTGKQTVHGPFKLGKRYGAKRLARTQTNWQRIRGRHQQRQAMRQQARRARLARRAERLRELNESSPILSDSYNVKLNLEVNTTGVHRVSYEQLVDAGLDLNGVRVRDLALLHRGVPVPLRVQGRAQHADKPGRRFGPGGFIEFIGAGLDTLYTGTNVYTLTVDRSQAQRVAVGERQVPRWAVPEAYYLERAEFAPQARYSFSAPTGDPWYAVRMIAYGRAYAGDFTVMVDGHAAAGAPAQLQVKLWGGSDLRNVDPDHHVQVAFNGAEVADDWFDGITAHTVDVELPAGALKAGANTLTLTLPFDTGGIFDLVNLESYTLRYLRAFVAKDGQLTFTSAGELFEVTGLPDEQVVVYRVDGSGVARLQGRVESRGEGYAVRFAGTPAPATYYVSTLAALPAVGFSIPGEAAMITAGEAQYLIITHQDFVGADLELLVQMKQAQGFTVKVVEVDDIYAQFGDYIVDAKALHDYIRHAVDKLGTEYVLLVGGDMYDYRNYLNLGAVSFIPSLYRQTDQIVRFAPVDAGYADVDGDDVPDVAIGRLPVRTVEELAVIVAKMAAYAQRDYTHSAVFAADDYDRGQLYSFTDDSEAMIAALPASWQAHITRAYMDEADTAGARQLLIDALNGGVALTSFTGHSGPSEWTFDGLFSGADAAVLANASKPTVVTQWGCWNTYYVSPAEDTLGHELMLNGDRGAVAVLGASTLTQAGAERELALEVYRRLFQPGMTIGRAVLEAKRAYAQRNPDQLDVILGWTQLGDPALVIQAQ